MSDQENTVGQNITPSLSLRDAMALRNPPPPGSHEKWTFYRRGTTPLPESLGAFSVLREFHDVGCVCSYCRTFASSGRFGLELPRNKHTNSWRILWWRWRGELQLVRWTMPNKRREAK